ncbi:M28 family metallopeptidase [Fodinibius sediminis]|uniref:Carboxypeptidase Q n=1 Tax=Fodinibius sediminis TaxID=1214077 RepID=A0A521E2M5_9BACT|nr:M28 family metallopeptidase [Fodinibius sediminis]SMO78214.1 carboxypeptidase Q [Fodinibius sediminis]
MLNLRFPILCFALPFLLSVTARGQSTSYDFSEYREEAETLIDAALQDDEAFQTLTYFADTFGHRLSGSQSLEHSIDWIVERMQEQPLDRVTTHPVMVPHWVRGEESATLIRPRRMDLPMLGLGGSISTPDGGLQAEVLVVNSFEELKSQADRARGKIVLYNVPFVTYGETVQYRMNGAIEAAKAGAVASLIRSVGPYSMKTPHTGTSNYQEDTPKIPHAAITTEHAAMLQRMQERGETIRLHLEMNARTLPDARSRNVIAEIKGSEKPGEIVVMGGHIDSWDVGQGVMDDAGGSFAAWEALLLMKELGLQPRRTVRVVMWTNEENGLRGATAYRDSVQADGSIDDHVLAIESDAGVFDPQGFGFSGSDEAYAMISAVGELLQPIDADNISRGGGGADIGPIMREGVPGMGLLVDSSRYFWYHHTAADTIDKLDPEEYKKCIAAMAVMAYVVADMPERLPR